MNTEEHFRNITEDLWRKMYSAVETNDVELAYQTSLSLRAIKEAKRIAIEKGKE